MYKKTVTYTDFNGNKRTEDFYFNFEEYELNDMEVSVEGGYLTMLQKAIDTNDSKILLSVFKDLVVNAYGEKSADGRYFQKSDEIKQNFVSTKAYSLIYSELARDAAAASEFVNKVFSSEITQRAKENEIQTAA